MVSLYAGIRVSSVFDQRTGMFSWGYLSAVDEYGLPRHTQAPVNMGFFGLDLSRVSKNSASVLYISTSNELSKSVLSNSWVWGPPSRSRNSSHGRLWGTG